MKTKGNIDLVEVKKQEMQEMFSDHIDFSDGGHLASVNPDIEKKSGRVSSKEQYREALLSLQKITGKTDPEEIISIIEEKEEISVEERMCLRLLLKFH